MLKKLRIKFIVVTMVATALVLIVIIGGINVNNYVKITKDADRTLEILADNDGQFPMRDDVQPPTGEGDGQNPQEKPVPDGMSPETPFETRYFTVTLNAQYEQVAVDTDRIVAIDQSKALEYATKLASKGKIKGFVDDYRYVAKNLDDGNIMYIFIDCGRELDTVNQFLLASCLISFAGFLVVFVLVVIFSKVVMKPVAETYKKQKQFITDANHELKTPLTVINASCEMLEYEDGANEWTTSIKEQVAKLTELTNKLVFLSRMDEESKRATMTDFCISEVVEDAIKPYYAVAESKGKKFDAKVEKNVSFKGDTSMIKQLIELLLDNAIKYSDEEGNIEIELSENGKNKKITVSNTTDGVPQGNLDVLFERFYRLESSRNSETGGHGIGLSVAKAIVDLHKGKISATSPDGKTIIFTIVF